LRPEARDRFIDLHVARDDQPCPMTRRAPFSKFWRR
jgi:hypothetical protein